MKPICIKKKKFNIMKEMFSNVNFEPIPLQDNKHKQ